MKSALHLHACHTCNVVLVSSSVKLVMHAILIWYRIVILFFFFVRGYRVVIGHSSGLAIIEIDHEEHVSTESSENALWAIYEEILIVHANQAWVDTENHDQRLEPLIKMSMSMLEEANWKLTSDNLM